MFRVPFSTLHSEPIAMTIMIMKNLTGINLLRAAACVLTAVLSLSCGKEEIKSGTEEEINEEKVVTFTGRFAEDPSTKVALDYDNTNKKVKVSFTGGETIITMGEGTNSATSEIKASDVNADGSVNFSIWFENASNPYYFFVGDNNNTFDFFDRANTAIYCKSNAYNSIAAGRIPHLAWGKCNPGETNVTFHNALCLLKYTTTTEEASYVDFCGNNGEKLVGMMGINYSKGTVSLREEEGSEASTTVRSDIAGPGKDNYIALMPNVTLSKGFLIKVYDKNGKELYICRVNSSLTTTAGKILDLGTLEDHKASPYNLWLSGYDIEINGVKYNKATYGEATLVEKGSTFGGDPGVYFINGEATMGSAFTGSNGNVIVFSNDTTSRAKITLAGKADLISCKSVAFKGLNIESLTSGYTIAGSGVTSRLTFDSCTLTLHSSLMDLSGFSSVNNIEMVDCDVITDIASGSSCCLFSTGALDESKFAFSSLSFKNNIFWSKLESREFRIIATDDTATGVPAGKVYMENNTFYNVDCGPYSAGFKPFIMLGAVTTSCSLKANLVYSPNGLDTNPLNSSRTAYLLGCYSKYYASQVDIAAMLANTPAWYGYDSALGGLCIYTDANGTLKYLQTGMKTVENDPFEEIDPSAGTYRKKSTYDGFGAER
jgi:hypothetical protein